MQGLVDIEFFEYAGERLVDNEIENMFGGGVGWYSIIQICLGVFFGLHVLCKT